MKKKLHILFLCGWYPSKVLPTNGDFIQRHAEAVSSKHKVSIFHIISDKNYKKSIEIDVKIINGIETYIAYLKTSKNIFAKPYLYYKAYKLLLSKIGYFDMIHLNQVFPFGIFCLVTKFFQKRPYIITEHWTGYLGVTKVNYFHKIVAKFIIKNASTISTVSNYQAEKMIALGYKGNYVTVGNVVDTKLFAPKKKEETYLKLIHISSLKDDHKNIKGMLDVAKRLDEKLAYFEWIFIGGDGAKYKNYLNELQLEKGEVSFLNHQNHSEMVNHLQAATICISFSNYETFGIVLAESIACGTPVIATNTGIAADFNNLNFCKVIPINDKELLYKSILNHKNIFGNVNINDMHIFIKHKFSKEVISSKFSFLYKETLKN